MQRKYRAQWKQGVFLEPNGNVEVNYSWGIGVALNNQAKIYVLFLGTKLLKIHQTKNIVNFSDPLYVINRARKRNPSEEQ